MKAKKHLGLQAAKYQMLDEEMQKEWCLITNHLDWKQRQRGTTNSFQVKSCVVLRRSKVNPGSPVEFIYKLWKRNGPPKRGLIDPVDDLLHLFLSVDVSDRLRISQPQNFGLRLLGCGGFSPRAMRRRGRISQLSQSWRFARERSERITQHQE